MAASRSSGWERYDYDIKTAATCWEWKRKCLAMMEKSIFRWVIFLHNFPTQATKLGTKTGSTRLLIAASKHRLSQVARFNCSCTFKWGSYNDLGLGRHYQPRAQNLSLNLVIKLNWLWYNAEVQHHRPDLISRLNLSHLHVHNKKERLNKWKLCANWLVISLRGSCGNTLNAKNSAEDVFSSLKISLTIEALSWKFFKKL